ncbi:MAG: hypothetical protein M3Y58_05510 [Chloroflexota bacterium]|nr:hypothetical protein [Chloroflexota bacterium]
MSNLSYDAIQQHYTEAMRYSGPEATGRLWIADRLAEAARDTLLTEAASGTSRVRPVLLSLGGLLVRLGERLEAVGTVERCEYV